MTLRPRNPADSIEMIRCLPDGTKMYNNTSEETKSSGCNNSMKQIKTWKVDKITNLPVNTAASCELSEPQ
jgi:hypothetical protein